MSTQNGPALPGLEQAGTPSNLMAQAAAQLIETLRSQQLIEAHHVLTVQLVLDLSTVIGKAAAKGQAAAMALAAKELREAMSLLPQPADAGDALAEFMEQFAKAGQS